MKERLHLDLKPYYTLGLNLLQLMFVIASIGLIAIGIHELLH